jgi:hypothetical protein
MTYVHSRDDSNTFTMGNPMPELTFTLCQSRLYPQSGTLDLSSGVQTSLVIHKKAQEHSISGLSIKKNNDFAFSVYNKLN